MALTIQQESRLWVDTGSNRFVTSSKYRPFLLSNAQKKTWEVMYDVSSDKFFSFRRVLTDQGHAFLISAGDRVVLSKAANRMSIHSGEFAVKFGSVIKTSAPLYSLVHPVVLEKMIPKGIDISECFSTASEKPISVEFAEWATLNCGMSSDVVNMLLNNVVATAPNPSKQLVNKLDDFRGLISKLEYERHIIPRGVRGSPKSMFFVTRGPKRGILLNVSSKSDRFLIGHVEYMSEKCLRGAVLCGQDDYSGKIHERLQSRHKVFIHQGVFLEAE